VNLSAAALLNRFRSPPVWTTGPNPWTTAPGCGQIVLAAVDDRPGECAWARARWRAADGRSGGVHRTSTGRGRSALRPSTVEQQWSTAPRRTATQDRPPHQQHDDGDDGV